MAGALVLNATYEVLCVVPIKRAIVLMLNERAELVTPTGREIRSERMAIPEPSVVRLSCYVKVPHVSQIALSRRAIFARDNYRCQYCGAPAENVDHVIPKCRGGLHKWDNVVASCRPCNAQKGDKLLSQTNFNLKRKPVQPQGRAWLISISTTRAEWQPFLRQSSRDRESLSA